MKNLQNSIMIAALLGALCLLVLTPAAASVVQMSDNGKTLRVKAGEVIELALPEQAGTGYTWEFHNLDQAHFKVLHTSVRPLAGAQRPGGPLQKIWRIKAQVPGQAILRLDYLRPWEGRAQAVNHFTIKVDIF